MAEKQCNYLRRPVDKYDQEKRQQSLLQDDKKQQERIDELHKNNAQLENDMNTLGNFVKKLQASEAAARTKIKELNTIILDSVPKDTDPTDDEVRSSFEQLRNMIVHFVRKYYNQEVFGRDAGGADLSEEMSIWLCVRRIASRIHEDLFRPSAAVFGFGPTDDKALNRVELRLLKEEQGKCCSASMGDGILTNGGSAEVRDHRLESTHLPTQ